MPGKFIAFQGPEDLSGYNYIDTQNGGSVFSLSYYADILKDFDVQTLLRLNERLYIEYNAKSVAPSGMRQVDLPFEDCFCPPDAVVVSFLHAVDSANGAIAVHCKAGLSRTGTLIALYMMWSCCFTAWGAIEWLRIMRSGCVIGEQQHCLLVCAVERARQQPRQGSFATSSE